MNLPELFSYSQEQIQKVQDFSPAFQRYYQLIQRKPQNFSEELRLERHNSWIRCVLAEFFQIASTGDICSFWSESADQILQKSCQRISNELKVPLALFAYGKLGSEELNLSSDIDLVFIAQEDAAQNNQFLRRFQTFVHEATEWGFCFRSDFDLRPGGRSGPMVPTVEQFKDYYGNYGEAWERLAFVRLRSIWGEIEVRDDILRFTEKFTFRKHLDFSLLSDLKDLRQKIHSQYSHRTLEDQIDLKLGLGGIRDLELFVHALQVVHGGRDINLRNKRTSDALNSLEEKQILPTEDIAFLKNHYWTLRRWENLVQAEGDQQTHLLKKIFSLQPDFSSLQEQMSHCDQLVSGLLGKVDIQTKTLSPTEEGQIQWLVGLGFAKADVETIWPEMVGSTALSRQRERDEGFRQKFLYLFLQELSKFPQHQDRSLRLLHDFLKATRAKATFYSLFLNQENLISQLARIFATSPYLASLLCSRPELIDSYIYRTESALLSDDPQVFLDSLSEKKLLSELVNGSEFIASLDLSHLLSRMTETADQISMSLLASVEKETGCRLPILALGKWGGREMGLKSDLDFIFVTDEEPQEKDMKAARKFFHRLTETHHRGGSLYSIDLRLKPSGKGGLVVSSFSQLETFLQTESEAWERQAYLRSRFISGLSSQKIIQACLARDLTPLELKKLNEIRKALVKNPLSGSDELDIKFCEGGLVDMEFSTQIAILHNKILTGPQTTEQMELLGWNKLIGLYNFMRLIEQMQQAVVLTSTSVLNFRSESFYSIASLLHESNSGLELRMRSALNDSRQLLKRLDPRRAHD